MTASLEELRSRLEVVADELADIAHEKLREALEAGGQEALAEERRLGRARRSVLKAAALLGERSGEDEEVGG
jgi:uncharacterized protein (DUF3084 family)